MEQRDFLMRQIEMLAIFLRKLIAKLLQLEESGETDGLLQLAEHAFTAELKINLQELAVMDNESFFEFLKERNFNAGHLEDFAKVLYLLGKTDGVEVSLTKMNYLQKSLLIFEKLEQESESFSIERNKRIQEIERMIKLN